MYPGGIKRLPWLGAKHSPWLAGAIRRKHRDVPSLLHVCPLQGHGGGSLAAMWSGRQKLGALVLSLRFLYMNLLTVPDA